MRKTITLITLASVIVVGGYLVLFRREALLGLVGIAVGYGPAKTPEEAIEKFKKAVKARDYNQAAKYVGGAYGEQLQRGADAAKDLGKSIDAFAAAADKRGIKLSDNIKVMLATLEPFPTSFDVKGLKKQDDDHATATLSQSGFWNVPVELKPEGEGDDRSWKLFIPSTPWVVRRQVSHLLEKSKDYARALEKVTDQIKDKSLTTKDDVEQALKTEMDAAVKD